MLLLVGVVVVFEAAVGAVVLMEVWVVDAPPPADVSEWE